MIRGVIFDCFGVLYVKASELYFSRFPEHHDELYDLDKMADHGFISRTDYIITVAKITGVDKAETAKAFATEYVANKPLVHEVRQLKAHYKIGLLSNIGRDWIQDFFSKHQLHDLFDTVVLSGEEGVTKPNPLIFERTAERLGLLTEECIIVDDRLQNCEAAESVGMKSILYTANSQFVTAFATATEETT